MSDSIPQKAASSKAVDSRLEQDQRSSPRSDAILAKRERVARISAEAARLLDGEETRLLMQADNVGLEQLIATLTRLAVPPRKKKLNGRR